MKITYCAATSRDGFIAKNDGDVSWLEEQGIAPEDTGLDEFFSSVDGLVMGRKTYDFIYNYGTWPYENKLSWVLTSTGLEKLEGANLILSNSIHDAIQDAKKHELKHLWLVGGGKLASDFLEANLLTHLSITELPVELGAGIPLFAHHCLEELACKEKTVREKKGFRQIEVHLQ